MIKNLLILAALAALVMVGCSSGEPSISVAGDPIPLQAQPATATSAVLKGTTFVMKVDDYDAARDWKTELSSDNASTKHPVPLAFRELVANLRQGGAEVEF